MVREQLRRGIPAQRSASPQVIAATAAFLLSDEAVCITGRDIVADGGLNGSN